MPRFTVRLAKGDPFAAGSRTFYGVPGKITSDPVTLELTPEQAESLRGHGVLVEMVLDSHYSKAGVGRGDMGVEVTESREVDTFAGKPARKGRA